MNSFVTYKQIIYAICICIIAWLDYTNVMIGNVTVSFTVYMALVFLIFVLGLLKVQKLSVRGLGLMLVSGVIVFSELNNYVFKLFDSGNLTLITYVVLEIIQYIVSYLIYSKSVLTEIVKPKSYLAISMVGIAVVIYDFVMGYGVVASPTFSVSVFCIYTVFSSLLFLFSLFNTPDLIKLNRNFDFLYAVGTLIIYSVVFWVVSFSPIYLKFSYEYLLKYKFMLAHFHGITSILGYTLLLNAILIDNKQKDTNKVVRRKWKEHPMITHKL